MLIKAKLRVKCDALQTSQSIIHCVKPDNQRMKGLSITSSASTDYASFSIAFDGKIETFISTLDDLARCVQAASATLGIMRKNRSR